MSLYIVLLNLLFSAVLADFSGSGPLLDGLVSSRRPARRHSRHRHRGNHHLDQWVLRHSYQDSDEASKPDSSVENETLGSFLESFPIERFDESNETESRGATGSKHRHRHGASDRSKRRSLVDTDDSEVFQEIPHELPAIRLERYKEQSVCKYTVENEMSSGLTHIRCQQPGKIKSDPRDHRYCVQTYMYTKPGCEYDVARGNVKLYTGCLYVIGKLPSKQIDTIFMND